MVLKRIGALSCAKVCGILYVFVGLIIGLIFTVIGLFISATGGASEFSGLMGLLFGVGSIIFFPIFYGLLGFIGGLIMAAIYNVVAGMVGGVELDLIPSAPKPEV